MRHTRLVLLSLVAAVAACSGPGSARRGANDDWVAIQRARLRAMRQAEAAVQPAAGAIDAASAHEPRTAPAAVGGSVGAAAVQRPEAAVRRVQAPQEPRHIDQIEPQRRPVRAGRPGYELRAGAGIGRVQVKSSGTRFDDSVRSGAAIVGIEAGEGSRSGPGFVLEYTRSADDLFDGELMNDGQFVQDATARVDGIDASPYWIWRPFLGGDFTMPVRAGVFVDTLRLQHESDVRRSWTSYGARVEVAPTLTVHRGSDDRIDLCGLLGFDVGGASFRETFVGGSDSDIVPRYMGEAGLGVRWTDGNFLGQIDYRLRNVEYGPTSTDLLGDDRRSTVGSGMLQLQAGLRF